MAVRLVDRIARSVGTRIPLVAIFQAPTIAQLAGRLAETDGAEAEEEPRTADVVTFHAAGDAPPLFALPGIGGTAAFTFRGLAEQLGTRYPVHGLQLRGTDGVSAPHATVEEMAAYQIENIRRLQPTGPYSLIGYSFGGRLAFEIAAQLRDAGERVAILAMVDSSAPGYPKVAPLSERLRLHLRELVSAGPVAAARYVGQRVRSLGNRARALAQRLRPPEIDPEDSPEDQLQTLAQVTRMAARRYEPRVSDQAMLLFRSEQKSEWLGASHDDPCNGWGEFATGEIEVVALDGGHVDAMTDANVVVMADRLRERLAGD